MSLNLVSALAVRENLVRLSFDVPIYFTGVLDPGDASDPTRYFLAPDLSTVGSDGQPPRLVSPALAELGPTPSSIDLWVDRRFSPFPSRYSVAVNRLFSGPLLEPLGAYQASFFGLRAGVPAPSPANAISNADIANPQSLSGALDPLSNPSDAVLGTYPIDSTGDIAKDEGLASYKKRIFRRLTTRKGSFSHLPEYGVIALQPVKMLARPGLTQQIAADAEAQIRQEPETIAVQVRIVMQGAVAFYRIRIRCSYGDSVDLLAPVSVSG